jgi:hypothetical protein
MSSALTIGKNYGAPFIPARVFTDWIESYAGFEGFSNRRGGIPELEDFGIPKTSDDDRSWWIVGAGRDAVRYVLYRDLSRSQLDI